MNARHSTVAQQPRRRRHGLTLLEVLLSAGLGIVLVGGIYTAIEQSWRMSASGKIELERQQVARAVLRQITLDVRSAAFAAKPSGETASGASGSTSGGTTGGLGTGTGGGTGAGNGSGDGASGTTEPTLIAGEEETQWTTSSGIVGTATELKIDLSNPRYLSSLMATNGQMPSDLQTVLYAVAAPSTGTGTSSSLPANPDRPDADGLGLIRSVTERAALSAVGNTTEASGASTATGTGLTKNLAQEISAIQFRYFNGLAWMTEWDTITMGELPRAIEVTIIFEPPQSRGVLTNSPVSIGTDRYRAVIPVPTSDPVLTEEAY